MLYSFSAGFDAPMAMESPNGFRRRCSDPELLGPSFGDRNLQVGEVAPVEFPRNIGMGEAEHPQLASTHPAQKAIVFRGVHAGGECAEPHGNPAFRNGSKPD